MTALPAPGDAARLAGFLREHPRWSVFWDKRAGVWRVAEDDPDSPLYTESSDAETVIGWRRVLRWQGSRSFRESGIGCR
jgi:hypothetical protein